MQEKRKIPVRKCTGCNNHFEKNLLVRIIRTPEGEIKLDPSGKMNGRGAYICKNPACLKKAEKQKRLQSALDVAIPPEIFLKLAEELS
jgi:predicted RNA-binding protein YlxR (DUF448 family)